MKKITSALLCVLLAALLCLGGCQISSGTHGRGTTTLSAEQLLADWNAIAEDDVTVEAGSVTEWLILRGLTGFDTYALSRLEGAYADYADAHEADLPTP